MSKRKRKRLFPKRFQASSVRTPRFDTVKAAVYNTQRSKATTGSGPNTLHNSDNSFMEEVPRTRSLSTYDAESELWVRSERGLVVDTKHAMIVAESKGLLGYYRAWQGQRHQGVSEFFTLTLEQTEKYKLDLLFSGNDCMFIYESFLRNVRSISRIYQGREYAMSRYKAESIAWISDEPLVK